MKRSTVDPIAIVGMACRLPGAPTLEAFWRLLREGRDGTGEVPADRWNADAVYDPDAKATGKTNTRRGGFIEGIDRFDAAFFGITPREAAQMDPQQRILLELTHDAFEDAGIAPATLAGSDTAVFVGAMTNDYFRRQIDDGYQRIDVHTGSGAGLCMLANRLSYQFDLRGPSVTVDTACSSSLVAVHQACQALWTGQSRAAVAAGVNVMLDPAIGVFYAKAGLSAPDARCKTFSAAADGIGRAEGAVVVILKRLKDAIADGDPIYAMIRGGAVNHDGRSNGLTQPNRWAQEHLLREAFRHARVDPRDLQYIELHGTGTLIGDPIEANALGAVLASNGEREPCLVGSVKTNFGHLEAAAGIAGLAKVALGIFHGEVPPSLWFDAPNPHIDFDALPLRVNAALSPWLASGAKRLAGVSSFGLGGANAHLVLQSAPTQAVPARRGRGAQATQCLLLSARSESALQATIESTQAWLARHPDTSLAAVCASSIRRKAVHPFRIAVTGADRGALLAGLDAASQGRAHPGVEQGRFRPSGHSLVLALPDLDLIDHALLSGIAPFPVARQAWLACRNVFARHGVALPTVDGIDAETRLSINAAGFRAWHFSAQYALARQVLSGAPTLQCVLADGLGQLAVLCALGAIELGEAAERLVAASDAFTLKEDFAFPVACDFSSGPNPRRVDLARGGSTRHWSQRLADSALRDADVIVVGAGMPALVASAQVHGTEAGDWVRMFARLAMRHALAWDAWASDQPFVRLPPYPWQRQAHWLATAEPKKDRALPPMAAMPSVPQAGDGRLLGERIDLPAPAWGRALNAAELPFLVDHAVQDAIILPGAGFVELGLAVHAQTHDRLPTRLAELRFHNALVIDPAAPPQMHVSLDEGTGRFGVHSRRQGAWELHAQGRIVDAPGDLPSAPVLEDLKSQCVRRIDAVAHYADMQSRGFGYGPAFRGVSEIWLAPDGARALARIVRPDALPATAAHEVMHPALFDAALQSMLATLTARGDRELYIPTGIDELTVFRPLPPRFWCHGGLGSAGKGRIEGDIVLFDDEGHLLARATGVRAQALTRKERPQPPGESVYYGWNWIEQERVASSVEEGTWLVMSDSPGGARLAVALNQASGRAKLVRRSTGFSADEAGFTIGPDIEADLARVLESLGGNRLAGVALALEPTADGAPARGEAVWPLVRVARTLARQTASARLVILTQGLSSVAPDDAVAAPGVAHGLALARVAANEFPALQVRLVDAAEDVDPSELAREINSDTREDEVALRVGARSVPRLQALAADVLDKQAQRPIRAQASYLITGGYGGFGLELADWLARSGATHIALAGRRGAVDAQSIARIQALRDRGVDVLEARVDIADEVQASLLLQQIRETHPPLKGIFHAAAVLDDAPLDQLTADQIDRAAGAKARGAWHLHRLTRDDALEHFVLFSSIASLLGGAGQGSYAMACAYLDALARQRHAQRLPALSINWGALADVGMATRFGDVDRYLDSTGVGMFSPAEAMQHLAAALRWDRPELGLARMDWARWARTYPAWAASPRYTGLAKPAAPDEAAAAPTAGAHAHLLGLSVDERIAAIADVLCQSLAEVMETEPDAIDRGMPLPSLGLDSLMAMDLIVAIEDAFAVKVPMLALMKGNSLAQVAALVEQGLGAVAAVTDANDAPTARSLDQLMDPESAERMIARLDDLADDEVERLLQQIMEEETTR